LSANDSEIEKRLWEAADELRANSLPTASKTDSVSQLLIPISDQVRLRLRVLRLPLR